MILEVASFAHTHLLVAVLVQPIFKISTPFNPKVGLLICRKTHLIMAHYHYIHALSNDSYGLSLEICTDYSVRHSHAQTHVLFNGSK